MQEAGTRHPIDCQLSTVNCQLRRIVPRLALALCLLVTLWGSRQVMREFFASEPVELANAATRLRAVEHPASG